MPKSEQMRDTMCKGCGIWTATLSPGGRGPVFCDDLCKRRAIAEDKYTPSAEEKRALNIDQDEHGAWYQFVGGSWHKYNWRTGTWGN